MLLTSASSIMKVFLPILMAVFVIGVVECSSHPGGGSDQKPPNIIFLLADDMVNIMHFFFKSEVLCLSSINFLGQSFLS